MNFPALIRQRQSTRKYSPRPVPRSLIDQCLDAARLAPSACNSQPWLFIVVDDRPALEILHKRAFSGIYAINDFVKEAPVIIAMVTKKSKAVAQIGGSIRGVRYSLIDIGIAGEHLAFQAAELGLGTCWLGWFREKAVKDVLGLGRKIHVDILFSLGYPEGSEIREKKRAPLESIRKYHKSK